MVRRLGNGLRSFETLVTAIVGLIALPDPTMFDLPLAGTLGNAPRNFLRGPDLKNVDFAINKDTRLREQAVVQFRAEVFNILNRPNFANPGTGQGTGAANNTNIIASLSSPAAIQCGPNYAVKSLQVVSPPAP